MKKSHKLCDNLNLFPLLIILGYFLIARVVHDHISLKALKRRKRHKVSAEVDYDVAERVKNAVY